ncbi:CatB-related O-acetyltransferase [Pseudidiomarina sp. 1ASP75-5]|nr:CatB-related O-acetyltransferase [Pseudidiomarina sp. 1ASP75-5]
MGKHSFIGYDCEIFNADIGSFVSIANNVKCGGGMHPLSWVSTSPAFYQGRDSIRKKFSLFPRNEPLRSIIGTDVWLGSNVLIKQGISVGIGAVVGMGSVVTKDVPPYAVVAGNPAKVIKYRFSKDIIEELLQSQWWDLDDQQLEEVSHSITDPIKFIENVKQLRNEVEL